MITAPAPLQNAQATIIRSVPFDSSSSSSRRTEPWEFEGTKLTSIGGTSDVRPGYFGSARSSARLSSLAKSAIFQSAITGVVAPCPLRPDAFQQHRGRFEVAVFAAGEFDFGRHQYAAERLGQDRLRQLVGPRSCRCHPLLDGVCQPEQGLDAADAASFSTAALGLLARSQPRAAESLRIGKILLIMG
jgi:hypothetical protein